MARGGKRPGAGRPKKGEVRPPKTNQARAPAGFDGPRLSADVVAAAAAAAKAHEINEASDLSPLDFLLSVQNDSRVPLAVRVQAARTAAPYKHQKLAESGLKDERKKKAAKTTETSTKYSPSAPPLSVVNGGKSS
jgi:hypothetical protein